MLSVKNNWQTLEYYDDNKFVNPNDIKEVIVQFPKAKSRKFKAIWKMSRVSYNDNGSTHYANQERLYVQLTYRGLTIDFDLYNYLAKLKVEIVK